MNIKIQGKEVSLPENFELCFEIRQGAKGQYLSLDRKSYVIISAIALMNGIALDNSSNNNNSSFE